MSVIPNVRANVVNSQITTANLFKGANANIANLICGNEVINGDLTVQGNSTFNGDIDINGLVDITGELEIVGNIGVTGYVSIYDLTDADCSLGSTGALVVEGGVYVGKKLHVGGTGCFDANVDVEGNLGVTGTINNAYLRFNTVTNSYSINNVFDGVSGNNNVAFGYMAGSSASSSDNYNVFIGSNAGPTIYGVSGNVFIGYQSGYGSTGSSCIAIGSNALYNNYTSHNIAIGEDSLQAGCSGSDSNIGIGTRSLYYNTSGRANIGIGFESLKENVSGENNVAIGHNSMKRDGCGENVAVGNNSLQNAGSYNNVAIGMDAGYGLEDTTDSDVRNSIYIGNQAGFNTSWGSDNIMIGYFAGATGSTGYNNVFIGSNSGPTGYIVGVTGNVFIGTSAGNWTTNDYNVFIGYESGATGSTTDYNGGTGNICIGAFSYPTSATMSNYVVLGDVKKEFYTTYNLMQSGGAGSWTAASDLRDKTDVENLPLSINLINQIEPVRYKWDKRIWYENGQPDGSKKLSNWTPGFIAQQLEQVQSNNDAEYLGLVDKSDPNKLRITTGGLIPVIIKALQDLSKENEELKARVLLLEEKINQ